MQRKRKFVVVGGVVLLLICCGTFGRTVWPPVQVEALCGTFESQLKGSISFASDGSFSASNITFGRNAAAELERISGTGELELERSLTASTEATLVMKDARARVGLEVERGWRGEVVLWRYVDDPDSGERETFRRTSSC
ncbi:hypothetical protein ACFYMB_01405 [Micromonospora haikouensis]|uniref:hypothetical protein n=1 Tax=Micromonospora haikouensis TaxID=686309 RepID=UPI00342AB034